MKILHSMLRVWNLKKSIRFYQDMFGMKLLRTSENTEYKYTLAFMWYLDGQSEIELTYNWWTESYEHWNAFWHIALGFDDIYETCEKIRAAWGTINREPGPVLGGTTQIAFVRDPDGYSIELIQNSQASEWLGK
jgi:lactoylglutathione lyase